MVNRVKPFLFSGTTYQRCISCIEIFAITEVSIPLYQVFAGYQLDSRCLHQRLLLQLKRWNHYHWGTSTSKWLFLFLSVTMKSISYLVYSPVFPLAIMIVMIFSPIFSYSCVERDIICTTTSYFEKERTSRIVLLSLALPPKKRRRKKG